MNTQSLKRILVLIRVMVAISMPAAGFFLLAVSEGTAQIGMSARSAAYRLSSTARKAPSEVNTARAEGARAVVDASRSAEPLSFTTAAVGLVASTLVTMLAMRAGRRVKGILRELHAVES